MMIVGIDVSKKKLDCLWLKDMTHNQIKTKVIPNTKLGHQLLVDWCLSHGKCALSEVHVIMEATGIYHESLAYHLHDAGIQVSVVNPAHIKAYANSLGRRSKTDKKDSFVLARYGITQHPALWQPEPIAVRQLKALLNRLHALESDIQREQNRLEKATEAHNTDIVVESMTHVLTQLQKEYKRIQQLIDDHFDQHPDLKQDQHLLQSIPGIGPVVSRWMLALLHSRSFQSAGQCAAFVGLVPIHHESGSSIKGRSRLSKTGNPLIRAKLYMAAIVATQYNPHIKALYDRLLAKGKTKMCALGAAMRKLVYLCYGVLKHQVPYVPLALQEK